MSTTTSAVSRSVPSITFLDNPPNPKRTMEALRELGYDSYASVLDLIDNSLDGGAKHVVIKISEQKGDILITIEDDGCGMDSETLEEALRLGSDLERDANELGKFGMGMVTASIGLSQKLEVLTREDGGPVLYGGFDLEQISTENRFVKFVGTASMEQESAFARDHGTVVLLSKTDRISNRHPTTFAGTLRKKVGQAFRKFLMTGIEIVINGQRAEAIDPLMQSHPDTKIALPETTLMVDETRSVVVKAVELPDFGLGGNRAHEIGQHSAGFYILRNNREIAEAVTFDFFKKHPEYQHFRAEVSFSGELDDFMHTDVKKASVNPPQGFKDKLRELTMGLITASSRAKKTRANTSRGTIDHSAAEANITRRAPLLPKPLTLVEKREPQSAAQPRKNGPSKPGAERKRTPLHATLKTVTGMKVVFNEADYDEQTPFYVVKQEQRTITVTYNRLHPFWRELVEFSEEAKVIAILDYLVFSMANAELIMPEQAAVVKAQVNTTLVGLLV
jgi:hypothetical protein